MKQHHRSLMYYLLLPLPVVALLMILTAWYVPRNIEQSVIRTAKSSAIATVRQFMVLRGYYTKNVVGPVNASNSVSVAVDHANDPNAIPLPATMIHELSALNSENTSRLSLYSAYPFPNRGGEELSGFRKAAWEFLVANPDATFSQAGVDADGNNILRVAVADKMVSEACVACHNSHAQTPKSDWKLGDVRGIMEVTQNIDASLAVGSQLGNQIIAVLGALFALLAGLLWSK